MKAVFRKAKVFFKKEREGHIVYIKKGNRSRLKNGGMGVMIFAKINIITKKILKTREAGKKI